MAKQLGKAIHAVGRCPIRFADHRMEGLGDVPRSGVPRKITNEAVHDVVMRTLETKPKIATHWSTESPQDSGQVKWTPLFVR